MSCNIFHFFINLDKDIFRKELELETRIWKKMDRRRRVKGTTKVDHL